MNKDPSFLEMDLFEDFVRENEKNIQRNPPEETFSWTFKKDGLDPLLDYMPPKLYRRYMDWKARRLREARLRHVDSDYSAFHLTSYLFLSINC